MRGGGPFPLLLLLTLGAPSGPLFIPPGPAPWAGGQKPALSPSPDDSGGVTVVETSTGGPSSTAATMPLVVDVEVEDGAGTSPVATRAATGTGTDTPATQPFQIQIDVEDVAANGSGAAAEPVWHPYLIKISGASDTTRAAESESPPSAAAAEDEPVTPTTEEVVVVAAATVSSTAAGTSASSSPPVLVEEPTPSTGPTTTGSRAADLPQPVVIFEVQDSTVPGQARQPPKKGGVPPAKERLQAEDEGEPEKPRPEDTSKKPKPSGPGKKAKKAALVAQVEEDEGEDGEEEENEEEEGTLLPLPVTEESGDHTETPQVYLLIKEVDLNSNESQRETEIPVAIQILTMETTISTETISTETVGTQATGTTVSSDVSETDETVINIDDKGISIEEKVEKTTTSDPEFKEMYIDQLVDHFSFSAHQKTYRQRYLMTDQFWLKSAGPLFLYTGNEGDIWDFANSSRFITELATEQQALVIFAEHRYYGKSLPFGKKSYEKINIEFLTVEQAVADYVVLVTKLKTDLDAESCPVIAFGGSYGGMLSAYIRIKYPHIVEGALASSAPVVSAANIGDSRQFFHDVTKDFERNSPDCVSKIREAFQELEKYAQQQAWYKIGNKLSLCKPLKSKKEVDHLYGWARNAFTYLAMFNYPYKTEMGLHFPANPVDVACHYILKKSDHIGGLLSILGMFYNSTGTKKCFDIYTEYQHCADPTGCGLGSASQAWDFQVCTEINLLYETNNKTDMFPVLPFTEGMRRNYCHSKWGVYPNTEWLKIQYWGDDFKAASNIIFSNGDLDPWANGGILRNVTPSVVAYIIEGAAHHLDLRASNPADPQSVTIIRKRESSIISEWVKKYQRHSI